VRRLAAIACLLAAACTGARGARAAAVPDSARARTGGVPDSAVAVAIANAGLEAVAAARTGAALGVLYENRSFRHSADALGHVAGIARAGAAPPAAVWATERRLGLASAAMSFVPATGPERVVYPGDRAFPPAPAGRRWGATERSLDLVLRPLVAYEVGRIFDPVLFRFELAPELRINPWTGARARASLVIPVRNDFAEDAAHPDVNNIRPGISTLEQFGWLPGSLLGSASGGIFDDHRYGVSAGVARPAFGGLVLLDAQADLTGYLAFPDSGVSYSTPEVWTGFGAVTLRHPTLSASLRVRVERYLYGDNGVEVQLRRRMGDIELALFGQRVEGNNIGGVRLALPLPPLRRSVGGPVRAMLSEWFTIEYRNEVSNQGLSVFGAASRENFMRDLDPSSLRSHRARYQRAAGLAAGPGRAPMREPVSLTGMTGFAYTPWCGVAPDQEMELGYNAISKEGAWDHRDQHRNDVYYGTVGFLPHVELGLRWTVIPGLKAFEEIVPESELTDSDRMVSGRVEVLPPRPGRPGLALGIEDAIGTRRFHSTYAVVGMELQKESLRGRLSVGYAPRILTASRYTLDGAFGAVSGGPWRGMTAALEHDSEKVNALLGYEARFGFRARFALLDLRHWAAGLGWSHAL
jgi:hypothetical protein